MIPLILLTKTIELMDLNDEVKKKIFLKLGFSDTAIVCGHY